MPTVWGICDGALVDWTFVWWWISKYCTSCPGLKEKHWKAKANNYTLFPLLQNIAGKYLSPPRLRYVDQASRLFTDAPT